MKKATLLLIIVMSVSLTGCFGWGEKEKAATTNAPAASTTNIEPAPQNVPSFEDGDLYIQAVDQHDAAICAKISNKEFAARCEKEVGL